MCFSDFSGLGKVASLISNTIEWCPIVSVRVPDKSVFSTSLVRMLSMHDFLQLGRLWVAIDITGEYPFLRIQSSKFDMILDLDSRRSMLKSPIICTPLSGSVVKMCSSLVIKASVLPLGGL